MIPVKMLFPLEDGKIAVDTSLSLDLSGRLAAQVSVVITPVGKHHTSSGPVPPTVASGQERPPQAVGHLHGVPSRAW